VVAQRLQQLEAPLLDLPVARRLEACQQVGQHQRHGARVQLLDHVARRGQSRLAHRLHLVLLRLQHQRQQRQQEGLGGRADGVGDLADGHDRALARRGARLVLGRGAQALEHALVLHRGDRARGG
jgi:hypothetical protein